MRPSILVLAGVLWTAVLLAAPAAQAAPTCQDRAGATVRCGTPRAMPVGWSLPPGELPERPDSDEPSQAQLIALACVLGGFFALLALMPEFGPADWDPQQSDDEGEG